jgi:5-methylcytosine-specific restriction endonuclease McrA
MGGPKIGAQNQKQKDMANNWNIPNWLEAEVRARDLVCVYCRIPFTHHKVAKKTAPSWEHIINDETIITRENIALCCCGCNASKGQKPLSFWLNSKYCEAKGITKESVAPIIQQAIAKGL